MRVAVFKKAISFKILNTMTYLKVVIANFGPFKTTENELIVENPSTGWILHAPPRLEIPCEQQLLIELAIHSFYFTFMSCSKRKTILLIKDYKNQDV
jgi:hypothetical protein